MLRHDLKPLSHQLHTCQRPISRGHLLETFSCPSRELRQPQIRSLGTHEIVVVSRLVPELDHTAGTD